jgi:uncharacterized protein (UPF0147 family)
MLRSNINPTSATAISGPLRDLGDDSRMAPEAREAIAAYVARLQPVLKRGDVSATVQLLRELGDDPRVPEPCRALIDQWLAGLEVHTAG